MASFKQFVQQLCTQRLRHPLHLGNLFFKTILVGGISLILLAPIFGIQIKQSGALIDVGWNWSWVFSASGIAAAAYLLLALSRYWMPNVRIHSDWHLTNRQQRIIFALLFLFAVIWPLFAARGPLTISTLVLIYIILGLSLNIVVGYTGLLSLGHAAFYAIGAYTYALGYKHFGLTFWQCLPLSVVSAGLFGLLLGFPVLRLRGDYLAIVTLGFGEIIRIFLNNSDRLTGGPDGVNRIPKPSLFGLEMSRKAKEGGQTFHQFFGIRFDTLHAEIYLYFLSLLLVALTLWVIHRLLKMPIGRSWEALREDEIACSSLGLNPTKTKLSAFVLGAAFAGIAGCLFAAKQGAVSPDSFSFMESAIILSIVVLGGMGSQLGVVIAAIVMTSLSLSQYLAEYRMLIFGVVLVLIMLWRPQGLLPVVRNRVELPR